MPIVTSPTLRSRATQDDILLAFADRLREHDKLNNQNVVVCDQPVPEDMPGGGFCVVVAPGAGQFPGELMAGAGASQVCEDGAVIIGVYTKIMRDRKGRREFSLFGRRIQIVPVDVDDPGSENPPESRKPSLLAGWKRDILKLLMVEAPAFGVDGDTATPLLEFGRKPWEPANADGVPLLRDLPSPRSVTGVLDVPGFPGWIGFQLTFGISWDWELYQ